MDTFFLVVAISGICLQVLLLILALFGPGLPYDIAEPPAEPLESREFARILATLSDSEAHDDTYIEVLTNGKVFYEVELDAIRSAKSHICLEAYILQQGEIAGRFLDALAERAAAGVEVRVILDAFGSLNVWRGTMRKLVAAGGEVHWYLPFRWYNLPRYNHRTHREIVIVDGLVGFVGGAGIADHWYKPIGKKKPWRDTMFRVEGRALASLQAMFAENWLESCGELLAASRFYPHRRVPGSPAALIINSTPSQGRATNARMLYQTLLVSATKSIHITTPYFLPDRSARRVLAQAVNSRKVDVKIIVPGKNTDHLLTRRSSRRIYGDLLRHGVQIYEYDPAMIHTKTMVVDGLWSVVGSTNFDHRSFGLNDETNLAVQDPVVAARLEEDFLLDMAGSRQVTYEEWRRRSPFERLHEWLGAIFERQQ